MQAASTCVDRSQAHTEISTQGGFEWERNRTESKRANECRFDVFSFGSWDYFWIHAEGKKKDRFSWRSYYYHTHCRILCLSTNLYRSLTNSTFHPLFTFGLGFLLKKIEAVLGRPHIFGQLHGCPAELNIRMIMMLSKALSPPDIIALINLPALCRYKVVLLGEHGAEDSLSTIERSLTQLYLHVINVWPLQLCNYTPENNPFFLAFFHNAKGKYKATEQQAQREGTMGMWKQEAGEWRQDGSRGKTRLTEVIVTDWRPEEEGEGEREREKKKGGEEKEEKPAEQRGGGKERMLISTYYFWSEDEQRGQRAHRRLNGFFFFLFVFTYISSLSIILKSQWIQILPQWFFFMFM